MRRTATWLSTVALALVAGAGGAAGAEPDGAGRYDHGGGRAGAVVDADGPVTAAETSVHTDRAGDVGVPEADILAGGGAYEGDILSLAVATAGTTDPTYPAWTGPRTYLLWELYVDGVPDVDFYVELSADSTTGEPYGLVLDDDFEVVCEAVPGWDRLDGGASFLGLSFLAPCIGRPEVVAYQTFFSYEQGGRRVVDAAPDAEATYLTRTPAPEPSPPQELPPLAAGTDGLRDPAARPGGYWMLGADGTTWGFGTAEVLAPPARPAPGHQAVALTGTPSGRGYWVLHDDGTLHAAGDAPAFDGVAGELLPGERASALSTTPAGDGLWVFTDRGRVMVRGSAQPYGDLAAVPLNGPVLGSVATPTGLGYYLVASDGGVFTFGDARFAGSMGDTPLNAPVEGLVPDPDGSGYWLVASDGGVFAFDADFRGSTGGVRLNRPIVGMVAHGNGYLMVGADGGIFTFSDAEFLGSLGGNPPAVPVVAVASSPHGPSATPVTAAAGWTALDRNGNGWRDAWAFDGNGNGRAEWFFIDNYEDGRFETALGDTYEDGWIDELYFDTDQNGRWNAHLLIHRSGFGGNRPSSQITLDADESGRWEVSSYDAGWDGIFEWVGGDANGDGQWDTWYAAQSLPSHVNAVATTARNVASISAVNILHAGGIPVFFPSAGPIIL